MPVKPYDIRTFAQLLDDLRTEQLVVPNFQRDFEWIRSKQHRLAASVLCGLPIGGMVMFSGRATDFAHRRLCSIKPLVTSRTQVTYLLDGQQRLATLRSIFDDPFADGQDWEEAWQYLHPPLQTRWVLSLRSLENVPHCFGSRDANGHPALDHGRAIQPPLEPADISDRIRGNRVTKRAAQGTAPWWHPAFEMQLNGSRRQRRREIAKKAADEEAIPLWEVARTNHLNDKPLHELAVRELALRLEIELRSRLTDDPHDETVLAVVEQTEPGVREELPIKATIERWLTNTSSTWASKVVQTLEHLMELQIPTITVSGELRRAVTIFENINEGGTPLTVFDLINAKAVPGFYEAKSLRSRVRRALGDTQPWEAPSPIINLIPSQYADDLVASLLTGVTTATFPAHIRNQYVNLLSIYGHEQDPESSDSELRVEYIKKEKQLELTARQINAVTATACTGLLRACLFLQARAGKARPETVSYALMLLPLAVALSRDELFDNPKVWAKLEYWYWVSLFGGRYRDRQNETAVKDVGDLYRWCVEEGDEDSPYQRFADRVLAEPRYSDRELFLTVGGTDPIPRAVSDGLLDFTLAGRPRDFLPEGWKGVMLTAAGARAAEQVVTTDANGEEREYDMELASHHIVPLATATKIDESSARLRTRGKSLYNSPLNKTWISKFANSKLGGRSPGRYFKEVTDAVLNRHYVGLGGKEIMRMVEEDDAFGDPPKEGGIRSVLAKRFDAIKASLQGRLDELEDQVTK